MTKKIAHHVTLLAAGAIIGMAISVAAVQIGVASADDAAPALLDAAPSPDAMIVTAGSAHASLPPIAMPGDDTPGFFLSSYRWVTSGNGWLALVPLLILFSWIAMHPKTWPLSKSKAFQAFIKSRRGKVAVVVAVALLGGLIHALAATGAPPGLSQLKLIGPEVIAAMGGYEGLRILILGK